jgi:hypothetical protein
VPTGLPTGLGEEWELMDESVSVIDDGEVGDEI